MALDDSYTRRILGYENVEEFYRDISSLSIIPKIKIPMVNTQSLRLENKCQLLFLFLCYTFTVKVILFMRNKNTKHKCLIYHPFSRILKKDIANDHLLICELLLVILI